MTTLKTPGGRPASSNTRARATTDAGVSVAGLITIVLPAISAAMDFQAGIAIGKFHGVIRAQTPTGWRTHIANLLRSSDGRRDAEEAAPLAGREIRHVDRFLHVAARLGEDLPHLARHQARQLLLVALQDLAGGIEDLGAPRRRRVAPAREGLPGGGDRPLHVLAPALGKQAHEVLDVGRVTVLEGPPGRGGHPLAADRVLPLFDCDLGRHSLLLLPSRA